MNNPFKIAALAVAHFFEGLYFEVKAAVTTDEGAAKLAADLHTVQKVAAIALPIVKEIGVLTGSWTIEDFANIASRYNVDVLPDGATALDTQNFLRNVAVTEVAKVSPGVGTNILNAAIEFAHLAASADVKAVKLAA